MRRDRAKRSLTMRARTIAGVALLAAFGCAWAAEPPAAGPPHALPAYPGSPYVDLDALKTGAILHVPTGRSLTEAELIDLATHARVIYIGEMHTNLEHHRVQLAVIRALRQRFPGRIAVGMEMFQRPSQPQLDQWARGELTPKQFKKLWHDNWGEDYEYYQPILDYLREQQIPIVALNASDAQVKSVSEKGWDGLSKEERAWLGPIEEHDPYHRRAMEAIFGGHGEGHGGPGGFERFYR
ncbi:MAG: ChaN family lipoprotein, partial [Nitrospirota bacterium]